MGCDIHVRVEYLGPVETVVVKDGEMVVAPWSGPPCRNHPWKGTRMNTRTLEVLDSAIDYLERHDWVQGMLRDSVDGRVCSLGAILCGQNFGADEEDLLSDDLELKSAVYALSLALPTKFQRMHYSNRCTIVAQWNDNCAKSRQEVIDTFRKAQKIELAGFDPDA